MSFAMALSSQSMKTFQALDATILLDAHACVSQRSFPDLQFESPKLLLPLVTLFAFTKKSLPPLFLQVAVGCY